VDDPPLPNEPAPGGDDLDDLESAVARAKTSNKGNGTNPLEALLEKTPPELRKILADEFGAEFFGPVHLDPEKLKQLAKKK